MNTHAMSGKSHISAFEQKPTSQRELDEIIERERAHQSEVWARTNLRLQKLTCDGVARYTVRGVKGLLPYSEAYDAVFKDSGCRMKDGINRFSPQGVKRLLHLNNLHAGVAREFLLSKAEEDRKKAEAHATRINTELAELEKVKEWYDEHDKLAVTICTDPKDSAYESEEECDKRDRLTALENMINASIWQRTSEKKFERKREMTLEEAASTI